MKATKKILSANKDVKIMALTMYGDEQFVKEMLDAGAVSYLLKEEIPEELLKAIGKVEHDPFNKRRRCTNGERVSG